MASLPHYMCLLSLPSILRHRSARLIDRTSSCVIMYPHTNVDPASLSVAFVPQLCCALHNACRALVSRAQNNDIKFLLSSRLFPSQAYTSLFACVPWTIEYLKRYICDVGKHYGMYRNKIEIYLISLSRNTTSTPRQDVAIWIHSFFV